MIATTYALPLGRAEFAPFPSASVSIVVDLRVADNRFEVFLVWDRRGALSKKELTTPYFSMT